MLRKRQRTVRKQADPLPALHRSLTLLVEFVELDWHKISTDELFERLDTSITRGLSSAQVSQRVKQYGRNTLTPPGSTWLRKTISYLFGGFGTLLLTCGILVFISWKPLGSPPAIANLALAIVLLIVWLIQASFAFFQDWSSSRVMASIKNMYAFFPSISNESH